MRERTRKWFASYVKDSFRDGADDDYVAARLLHRFDLDQQFLWASLQALEKYLKATLLFSYRSTKEHGHNLDSLVAAVEGIPELDFHLPRHIREFVSYINDYGENRYLDHSALLQEWSLLKLDWTVWTIRLYSRDYLLLPGDSERWPEESRTRLAELRAARDSKRPHRVGIPGGRLEQFLENRASPQRAALIWKNPCFGSRYRPTIRGYQDRLSVRKPAHVMRPEILPHVLELVRFPRTIRRELEAMGDRAKPGLAGHS